MATLDPTKGIFPSDNTGGILKQVDNSGTVDNVFTFTDGSHTFQWTNNPLAVYPISQARILAGDTADKTAVLQAIINHPANVKTIVFDAQQEVTVNGTLNCAGKKFQFTAGAILTGTGTIINAIIDADLEHQIFQTSVKLVSCRVAGDRFSVKWFGATGNGSTDDQPAIQKAIDTIVFNPTLGKDLYFPNGIYKINAPIIVYNWDGHQYQFTSVNLIGGVASHFTDTTSEAIIQANFTDTFAIGIQRARSLKIRGLCIQGKMVTQFKSAVDYYEGNYATWASQWGVRDSPNSPYAAIVVDPFLMNAGVLPPDGGYPGLASWYRGSETGGTSGVMIEECRINGFAVGIMLSPATQTQNAENIHVDYITVENCKVAYASSQKQEKNNSLKNLISWSGVHTILDTCTYGQLQGCPPNIDGMNIAGGPGNSVVRLFNINGLQFNVAFKNIFAEVLYRLGNVRGGGGMIAFEACTLDFNGILPLVPSEHAIIETVKFDSCNLFYYDDLFNKRLAFKGHNSTFINCRFDKMPYFTDQIETQRTGNAFINCVSNGAVIGVPYFQGNIDGRTDLLIPTGHMKVQRGATGLGEVITDMYLEINAASPDLYLNAAIQGYAFALDEANRVGTFTSPQPYLIVPDDYIIAYDLQLLSYVSLGRVTGVDLVTGQITTAEVPQGVDDSHQFYTIYMPKIKSVHTGFLCNATQNSTTLTNVDTDGWGGYVGDFIHQYMPTLDGMLETNTTLRGPAYTVYGDDLFVPQYGIYGDNSCFEYIISIISPDQYATIFPTSTLLMKPNTIWIKKPRIGVTKETIYRFTTPGYLNAAGAGKTRQAIWQAE